MKDNFIERLSYASNVSFFDLINNKETVKIASKKLDLFQEQWKKQKGHNRGGIVSSTYDVLHALLACIAPTMDDIRKNQPELFVESVQEEQIFAFVYRSTLVSKINQGRKFKSAQLTVETIANQIKRLIEAGVIIEKKNYKLRRATKGKLKGKLINPLPSDLSPKGKGKIQLFFNPEVLVFKPKFERLKAYLKNTFQQYRASSLYFNKSTIRTIIDSACNVDKKKKASAIAEGESIKIKNKEQGRKLEEKSKIPPRQFDKKEDFCTFQLYELCRSRLFNNRHFTQTIEKAAFQAIDQRINQAIEAVRAYKAEKIRTYKARETYQKSTKKDWMLARYREQLPDTYRAALEIVSFAIQKQEKNAINRGYIKKIQRNSNDPVQLFNSSNFEYALNYSINDWRKIQNNFFAKNKSFDSYCTIVGMVGKIYTHVLTLSKESLVHGYLISIQAYQKLKTQLNQNTLLTNSNKKAIDALFKTRFASLFQALSPKEKQHLKQSLKNK